MEGMHRLYINDTDFDTPTAVSVPKMGSRVADICVFHDDMHAQIFNHVEN